MFNNNQSANGFTSFTEQPSPQTTQGENDDSNKFIKIKKTINTIKVIFLIGTILLSLPSIIVIIGVIIDTIDKRQFPDPDSNPTVIMYLQQYGNINIEPPKGKPGSNWSKSKDGEKIKSVSNRYILDTEPNKLIIVLSYSTKKQKETEVYKYKVSLYEGRGLDTFRDNLFEFVFEQNADSIKQLLEKHPSFSYDEENKTITLPSDYQESEVEGYFKELLELPYYNMLYSVCYNSPIDQEHTSNSFYDNVCEDALPKIDFGLEGRANQLFANMKDKKIEPLSSRLEVNE